MGFFDSFAHSLTASSTGGFSTKASSIAFFESGPIEWVLICAMFLGGLNLGIIWWIGRRKIRNIKSNNELRLYLLMFFGGVVLFWLKGDFIGSFSYQVRDASFKVASLLSTTGFVNKDWEFSSGISAIALLLLATGGMAGSPGSGFGVHRLIALIKYLRRELTRKYNRQAIRKIKVSGEVVNERELDKLQGYTAIFIFIIAMGSFLISLDNESLRIEDSIAVSLSAFVTAGPPITEATLAIEYGIIGNFTLSVLMVVGRLSILPAAYMILKLSQSIKLNLRGLFLAKDLMMKFSRRFLLEGLFESATINIIGLTLLFLTPGLVVSGLIEWVSADSHNEFSLFATAVIAAFLGLSLRAVTSIADDSMDRPKAIFSVVAWSWVGCVLIGMLPYLFAGVFPWSRIDNALFETISGFSTTGSTVLQILKPIVAVFYFGVNLRNGMEGWGSLCWQ